MKKLLMFFAGLLLMCLTFGMVVVGGAIYDTASKKSIDTFFFQPANLSSRRIGDLKSFDELNDEDIRQMLVDKFITEYFYVIPDPNNIAARLGGKIGLRWMTSPAVFTQWSETVGAEITQMADEHKMRMARLVEMELPEDSDKWWTLTYELTTWEHPNDLSHEPAVTTGTMYVKLQFEPGIRPQMYGEKFDLGKFLEQGGDPSLIFRFRIDDIEQGNR